MDDDDDNDDDDDDDGDKNLSHVQVNLLFPCVKLTRVIKVYGINTITVSTSIYRRA